MKKIKIALWGMGQVGHSRLKALEALEGFELAGTLSRRAGVGSLEIEAALRDESIDAVAISTENSDHAHSSRRALNAGKHVLCDYPLAFTQTEAKALLDLARAQNKILQIEHIALLTTAHRALKEKVKSLGALKSAQFCFTAGLESYQPKRSGPFALQAEPRLLQLADLFGDFELLEGGYDLSEDWGSIQLKLRFKNGGILNFEETRRPQLRRFRTLNATFENGPLTWPEVAQPKGLFQEDLEHFHDRLFQSQPAYFDEALMLKIIGILECLPRRGIK